MSSRLRINYDLRNSSADSSQRMLNALLPGTELPIHRHNRTSESVVVLCGKMDEVFFEEDAEGTSLHEIKRVTLGPKNGCYGVQIPKGVWHTVEVIEPTVIMESKDGQYAPPAEDEVWNK